jgi:ABC-type branched-subunit amino acid transport system substrate-binding protein
VGVDAKNIYLAATEVESGIGSSFLAPVRYGMLAVLQKTNRAGGVCGRQLQLTLKDDGWSASLGKQYIDNFIQSQNYFALAVVPSSEGLNAASQGHDLDNAPDKMTNSKGIPVVGTDGMLNSQYSDPWIWPVAASTATSMRIMAHDAHARAARDGQPQTYGLVYNQTYKFGVEGAAAFRKQIARDGGTIPAGCDMALAAGQTSYKDQVNTFNNACGRNGPGGGVSFVALLLEPQTAETWLQDGPFMGTRANGSGEGAGGPQPLFDDNFGSACGAICANMQVWTSFYPPLFPFSQKAEVQTFKRDLCAVDSHCDVDGDSAFTEGGYLGMDLLVRALQEQGKTGAPLTRSSLKDTLDHLTVNSGLSGALTYKAGNHTANKNMVAFKDTYGQQFTGFQMVQGSEQSDPCGGCQDGS